MKHPVFCVYCGHQLTNGEIDGRTRSLCPHCGQVAYENPVPATAAVVINSRQQILLVKRGVEPHRGHWSLPGGFLEIDETPEQGCLRELFEETNLKGEIRRLVGVYRGESCTYRAVVIIGYQVNVDNRRAVAGDDSAEVRYFSLQEMPEIAFRSHRELLKDALEMQEG